MRNASLGRQQCRCWGPTLVGGCLRSLGASYVVEGSGRATVRSPSGYAEGRKCLRVGCNGLTDLAWHGECLQVLCNGLKVLHGKQRERMGLLDDVEVSVFSERADADKQNRSHALLGHAGGSTPLEQEAATLEIVGASTTKTDYLWPCDFIPTVLCDLSPFEVHEIQHSQSMMLQLLRSTGNRL